MSNLFRGYELNQSGQTKLDKVRSDFETLLTQITNLKPVENRELALAKTHLETACFYATKALAMNSENWKSK